MLSSGPQRRVMVPLSASGERPERVAATRPVAARALGAGVYFTNFSDLSGATAIISRVVSGVVVLASGIGLWLVRGERDASQ
ncbi:hypothetical protein ABH931_003975 [Streptacidiphilus sp. MAP12-33]